MALDVPSQIDRFRLVSCASNQPAGAVYVAWDPDLRAEVFLRLPPRGLLGTPKLNDWFQREFDRSSRLRHPNLCRLLDTAMGEGVGPCLITERPAGTPLADLLAHPLPRAAVLHLLIQLRRAFRAAQEMDVVPGALDARQIVLTPEGLVKVALVDGHGSVPDPESLFASLFLSFARRLVEGPPDAPFEKDAFPTSMREVLLRAREAAETGQAPTMGIQLNLLIMASQLPEPEEAELSRLAAGETPPAPTPHLAHLQHSFSTDPAAASDLSPQASFQWSCATPQPLAGADKQDAQAAAIAPASPRRSKTPFLLGAGLVLALAGAALLFLMRRPPAIGIQSEPPGAEIHVEGRTLGTTPLPPTRSIRPGMHVEVTRNGYQPARQQVPAGATLLQFQLLPEVSLPAPTPPEPTPEPEKPEPRATAPAPVRPAPKPAKPAAPPSTPNTGPDVFDQLRQS